MIEITVNGEPKTIEPAQSVARLIETLGLERHLVAVEVNRDLVRRTSFETHMLAAGDRVEIVEFVGGG